MTRDTTFDSLIPELPTWNAGAGISIDEWIGAIGRHDHAIGYGRVFWPAFVKHDGYLLRAGFSEEALAGFVTQCDGDRRRVEAVMNHEHVHDIFVGMLNVGEEPLPAQVDHLGRLLCDMWCTKLRRDFPDLNVTVNFDGDVITVFQAAEAA